MALNIDIPQPNVAVSTPTAEAKTAAKKREPVVDLSAAPSLDLDALLAKIKDSKPEAGAGKGRTPSALASKIAEGLMGLVTKATEGGVAKLPFGSCVKAIAIALGVDGSKKSQYFYTLSQSVLKVLGDKIAIEKDGRSVFIICAGDAVTE